MNEKKLKSSLIIICCLVVALFSEIQCMDKQTDILEASLVNHNANMQLSSQNEIDDLSFKSTSSNIVDSETSWASFLISPFVSTMQFTNNFISFAKQNPKYAMILGLTLTIQAVDAIVYCDCYCSGAPLNSKGQPVSVAANPYNDALSCQTSCKEAGWGGILVENISNSCGAMYFFQ